jgi:hypothetical protein
MHGVTREHNRENTRATSPSTTTSNTWGESMIIPKPPQTFRYIFQNIQGLPINPQSHKHQQIGTALKETEADMFGMAKLNLNFTVLGPRYQWSERFRNFHRNHSIHTYNRHDISKKRTLFGGTAQMATGAFSH